MSPLKTPHPSFLIFFLLAPFAGFGAFQLLLQLVLGTNLLERLGCTSIFAPAGPIFGPDLALRNLLSANPC